MNYLTPISLKQVYKVRPLTSPVYFFSLLFLLAIISSGLKVGISLLLLLSFVHLTFKTWLRITIIKFKDDDFRILLNFYGGRARHSSVDSSAPTILPPCVWVSSTPFMLKSFIIFLLYLWKNKNKQKETGLAHFLKKRDFYRELFHRFLDIIICCNVRTLVPWA